MIVTEKALMIATRARFVAEFWTELSSRTAAGWRPTHEGVYNHLSDIYEDSFGERLFPSFDAFRKWRDRHL